MRRLNHPVRSVLKLTVYTAAAITLTIILPVMPGEQYLHAQSQSSRETARAEMEARQRALWNLEKVKQKLSRRPSEPHLMTYQQIKDDFEQLQRVNYHLAGTVIAGQAIDYAQIRKDAAEVKKRASRLKNNLVLPEFEKDEKLQKSLDQLAASEELKPAIDALDAIVNRFVWNPVFQQPNVLDVENSVKARRDLEAILKLSEQIQKRAEALSKTAAKSQ
ncbi:MAG TPA: hypothetical protein VF553_00990 [Pyrinomonadaceae bacterium]|jgi:hypothetical protein